MDLTPETLLHDRYRIERLLGEGGMGAVYQALDTALDQRVAVKVNHRQGEESTDQFYREAKLLASLRHPHLPRVIDYFIIANNQFLVMDFIPGQDLGEYIQKNGPQPVEKVQKWARQLGEALEYLHTQNPPVLHRDIKPANIKITPEEDVYLVDFGIAKASDSAQVTHTGASGYTPGFAPPEQYGASRTGPYSDQFSLAATLYMLLTGQRPTDAVQRALNQAVLTPMNLLNPRIPASVQEAIEKALSPNATERFSSVHEFLQAFIGQAQATQAVPRTPAQAAEPTLSHPTDGGSMATQVAPRPAAPPPVPPPAGLTGTGKSFGKGWVWMLVAAGIGILAILSLAVVFVLTRLNRATGQEPTATVMAILAELQATVQPQATSPATLTAAPTILPSHTATLLPSATFTLTPAPTSPPAMLGGGGVVAFSSDRAGGILQIWTMPVYLDNSGRAYAGDPIQVTFDPGDKTQPAWSTDGKKLAYVAPGGINAEGEDLGLDIWTMNADGSEQVDISQKIGDDTQPAWSPNGSAIAFTNDGRADKIKQLYFIAVDGSNIRRVSFDLQEYGPTWSPDGQYIAYILAASSHKILYLRSKDDNFTKPLAFDKTQIFGRFGDVEQPAYSPDGNWIAYTRLEGRNTRIFSAQVAQRGANFTGLTSTEKDKDPAWSPDSQWIVFTSERDGNPEIYIMSANGQFQVDLTNSASVDMQPAWQPVSEP